MFDMNEEKNIVMVEGKTSMLKDDDMPNIPVLRKS